MSAQFPTSASRRTLLSVCVASVLLLISLVLLAPRPAGAATATPPFAPPLPSDSFVTYLPKVAQYARGNPLNVVASLDAGHAVSATVPMTGGVLSLIAADGTHFTLTIPDKALLEPTTITMTPVRAIDWLPGDSGPFEAVQLAPEGLQLFQPATLQIEPAQPIPLARQTGFSYYGAGEDFHLYPLQPGRDSIVLKLVHFSGEGVGDWSASTSAAVAQSSPSHIEAQLAQSAAEVASRLRDGEINFDQYLDEMTVLYRRYWQEVVWPLLSQAETNDEIIVRAVTTYLGWLQSVQILGIPDRFATEIATSDASMLRGLKNAFDKAFERCVDNNDPSQIYKILELERLAQMLGLDLGASGIERVQKCARFELTFDSAVRVDYGANDYASAHVRSKTLLHISDDLTHLEGEAPLEYLEYVQQVLPPCYVTVDKLEDSITRVPSAMINLYLRGKDNPSPGVAVQSLLLNPGGPVETHSLHCPYGGGGTSQTSFWYWTYRRLHTDEGDGPPYTVVDWTPGSGEVYATKIYQRSQSDGGALMHDDTTLTLKHAPLK